MESRQHFTCTIVGHSVFIIGTTGALGFDSNSWGAILDLNARIWRQAPGFVFGMRLAGHSATLVAEKIYIFGITFALWGGMTRKSSELRALDLVSATWVTCPTYGETPVHTSFHSADYVEALGMIVFIGGITDRASWPLVSILKVESQTWSQPVLKGEQPAPRYMHVSCATRDSVVVTGGRMLGGARGRLNDSSLYVLALKGQMTWHKVAIAQWPLIDVKWMAIDGNRILIYGPTEQRRRHALAETRLRWSSSGEAQGWAPVLCNGIPDVEQATSQVAVSCGSTMIIFTGGLMDPGVHEALPLAGT